MTNFDFFDLVLKSWERPVREATGYKFIEVDDGYQIVLNALGIKEADIEIKVDGDILSVYGKTENEAIHFTNSVNYKFSVARIKNDLQEVKYELQDGLLIVHLLTNKEPERLIKISKK